MSGLDRTRYATGENASQTWVPDRRQINVPCSIEQFQKVKDEALRQGVSMSEVMRQLVDLL